MDAARLNICVDKGESFQFVPIRLRTGYNYDTSQIRSPFGRPTHLMSDRSLSLRELHPDPRTAAQPHRDWRRSIGFDHPRVQKKV